MVTGKGAEARRGCRNGFALVEILVGVCVLALTTACLMSYFPSMRRALSQGNQLADATRAASSALETVKGQVADSLAFKTLYDGAELQPFSQEIERDINNRKITIRLTISRAPSPLYALR
jgi:type II secretory pathway pseudopilin PulG